MYTSGSTGRPNAVGVTQAGLVNYLTWASDAYRAGSGRSLVHSSIGFDLTVTSLWAPLVSGGCSVLVPDSEGVFGLAARLRAEQPVNLVKLTPSHLRILNQMLKSAHWREKIGTLVIGGEALGYELLAQLRQASPATRIVNEYGPTETVVGSCAYFVGEDDPDHGPVPIGRPIANTTILLLDEQFRPVPDSDVGELVIRGVAVARGYLNNAEATVRRFRELSISSNPRCYCTGDLARRSPSGELEYLGRRDNQLKINGVRIEPGEVEAALVAFPGITAAAVVAHVQADPRQALPEDVRLAAYVVADSPQAISRAALDDHLRARLPAALVPAWIGFLRELPMTPNGKLDRAQLPSPGPAWSDRSQAT
jgi:nonribosomal peptide synthetase protein BlmX